MKWEVYDKKFREEAIKQKVDNQKIEKCLEYAKNLYKKKFL